MPNLISFVMEISGNARFIHLLTTGSLWFHDALMKMNGFEKMSSWFNRPLDPLALSFFHVLYNWRYSLFDSRNWQTRGATSLEISIPYIEIFSIIQKYADVYDANDGGTGSVDAFFGREGTVRLVRISTVQIENPPIIRCIRRRKCFQLVRD